jgi:hypothetical protein
MQVAYRVDVDGAVTYIHNYKEVAEENIQRTRSLEVPRVQVLVAHDKVWHGENKAKGCSYHTQYCLLRMYSLTRQVVADNIHDIIHI